MRIVVSLLAALAALPAPAGASARPEPQVRLAEAWQKLHPGQPAPAACPGADPVRERVADLDESPGNETALASLRYGVVLLSAAGQPLGSLELGCGPPGAQDGSEVVELGAVHATGLVPLDLAVRTRQLGHCGRQGQWLLLLRRGTALLPLLTIDDDVERACGIAPQETFRATIEVLAAGRLRVTTEGTTRAYRAGGDYGPPQRLHRSTLFELQPGGRFAARPDR